MYEKYEHADLRIMTHNVWNGMPYGRDARYGDLFRSYDPDVLLLQEMSDHIRTETMLSELTKTYEFVPVDTEGYTNYTPILLKKDAFRILECGWHLFSGYNDANSKSITWAALEKKDTGERFGVASNHFWWMQPEAEHKAWRVENAREMHAFTEYLRVRYDMPVITAGDFNCTMTEEAYAEILRGGAMDAITCAQVSACHRNTCNDCYPVRDENDICRPAPQLKGTGMDAIDHIFIYGIDRIDVYVHNVIDGEDVRQQSDHCPVYIDCTVRNRPADCPRVFSR